MTIQEKLVFRQGVPYDAMGDYSVFEKALEEKKNLSSKEEQSSNALKPQKAGR